MHRPILTVLATLIVLLTAASGAQAATPFTAGTGGSPEVAVDAGGSGHVVWVQGGTNAQVGYCRIAPGASACNKSTSLNFGTSSGANSSGRAAVFTVAPNKVVVVAACWQCPTGTNDRTYSWTSTDNGTSFGAPVQIGEGFKSNGTGAWLDDVGIFVAASSGSIKATAGIPYASGGGVAYATGGLYVYSPQVVRLPGTNTLVAATNDLDRVKYGVYAGGSLSTTAINRTTSPINWNIDRTLSAAEADNSETALNSGPNGIYLSYLSRAPGNVQVGLRHFAPGTGTFGPPVYVEGTDAIDSNGLDSPDSFQDAAGRVHLVWRSLHEGGRLRYRVSDTSGTNFGPVANIAATESFLDPQVSAGTDGKGFAVWSQASSHAVRAVPLDPTAEPGGPGAPGGPAGPAPDVSRAEIGDRTLTPGQGTTFSFNSSKAGSAVLTIEKKFKGLKVKRKVKAKSGKAKAKRVCVPATKKRLRALRRKAGSKRAYRKLLKKKTCRSFRKVGEIRQQVKSGRNTIRFNGRVAGRKLGKGSYRAKLVITDSAGQPSRTETLRFKVVGKKSK